MEDNRILVTEPPQLKMRVSSHLNCYLCNNSGTILYEGLQDRLHDVEGVWALRKCTENTCGFVWLDPMPVEEDIGQAYSKYFTHTSTFDSFAFRFRQRIKRGYVGHKYNYKNRIALVDLLLASPLLLSTFAQDEVICTVSQYLQNPNTGRLLEIGCGNGTLLKTLQELGWETEGIDFDSQAIENLRHNFNLNVHAGTLINQQYPTGHFDAIVMSHVIEHLHDPISVLSECRRILKKNGKLIILTPNIESLGARSFKASWLHLDPPRHLYLFSLNTLRKTIEKSGLRTIEIKTTARDAKMSWILSRQIEQNQKCQKNLKLNASTLREGKQFALKEKAALVEEATIGEELVLLAQK